VRRGKSETGSAKTICRPVPASTLAVVAMLFVAGSGAASETGIQAGQRAYEASEYAKAAQLLFEAAAAEPKNAEIQLLLTKTHLEMQQYDAAIKSAEKAVALEAKSSENHEWLGRAYGEKADHSSFLSALSFAKKTRKEFQDAVELDGNNFAARQALIEFDCAAPAIAGGGEDKAQAEMAKMAALDAAEGHYAMGNCRRQKKDFAAADAEFSKALQSVLRSPERVFDIGDYAVRHGEAPMLLAVAEAGEKIAAGDIRGKFYHAVAWILTKRDAGEAQRQLREYLKSAPTRSGYPRPSMAHYWLGQSFENQGDTPAARNEYEAALKQDPKNKSAQEALRKLKKG
jgi:tetratricopeptide (TPR) repeat protein